MKKYILTIFAAVLVLNIHAQHNIIPAPVKYETTTDAFVIDDNVAIGIKPDDVQVKIYAEQFKEFLTGIGIKSTVQRAKDVKSIKKTIVISLNKKYNKELGEEGYALDVNKEKISIKANKPGGVFNSLQTLRQLFNPKYENPDYKLTGPIAINGCKIKDYPRFKWRGLMFDVSRHFFSVKDVKRFIDKMSQYKYNVFHWHLTDDEGWRIEIKSLPKLTETGAWRVERQGRFGKDRPYPKEGEKATYGGFYTHGQIKDVIKYASERNITIVPEIDMPGHSMAALAAYPELSVNKEPKFVNPGSKFVEWYGGGKFKMLIENTLNPTDEKVYEFIDKVFTEVAELFPGKYIHMGGDECYQGYWEADSMVQVFMKKKKLKNGHDLQNYFVNRVNKIISSKGKKMIGWDEIADGGSKEDFAVMNWRSIKGAKKAIKAGHEVVMTPVEFCYLDYTQGDHSVENKIYAGLSLEKTYEFEPVSKGLNSKLILGGQGNLWTEVIPNIQYAFYMAYPRAFALSETFWSPEGSKNWEDFINRTEFHFYRFNETNTNVCKAIYDPIVKVYKDGDKLVCELENPMPNTEIYYTVDNTYPVKFGLKYSGAFEIPEGDLSLRTQTYRYNKPLGRELIIHRKELEK
ncbi:MAG: family 20 glycosylhydrolase, partial [bacterium]|nr:family 20 glycosylhydrolase [bacterium]